MLQKTITNKIEAQYGEAKKESNTVTTNVAKGQIEVSLVAAEAAETVKPGYQYRYIVSVKNISNKDIKNIKLQFDIGGILMIHLNGDRFIGPR